MSSLWTQGQVYIYDCGTYVSSGSSGTCGRGEDQAPAGTYVTTSVASFCPHAGGVLGDNRETE